MPASPINCFHIPHEVQKAIFQDYITVIYIKQLFFNHFHSIHHFKTVNPLLSYVTGKCSK